MPILPIPISASVSLDVDSQSSNTASVALYNAYIDRAGAARTLPPNRLYADLSEYVGNATVYAYDSADNRQTLAIAAGRLFRQTEDGGAWTELIGADLVAGVVPSFVEDRDSILFTAGGSINRLVPSESVVTQIGDYIAPTADDPIELGVYFDVLGDEASYRVVTLVSDQAKEIRYTTDGTEPTAASTLYDLPVVIAADTTLKAVAIDNDDVVSDVTSEKFVVNVTDTTKPTMLQFNTGTVYDNEVEISALSAIDNKANTRWCITESATPPLLNDTGWVTPKPVRYKHRIAAGATVDLYAWVRDAAGNISNAFSKETVTFLDADTVPDTFTFTTQDPVARGSVTTSEAISIPGINFDTTISIQNGEYAISSNSGATWTNWRTADGTVKDEDVVKVRHTSSTDYASNTVTTLTIGGVSATFTSTTLANQTPRQVVKLVFLDGYLLCKGLPYTGAEILGDTFYSNDRENNYSAWEFYNNQSLGDGLQSLIVAFNQVYNIGTRSLEISFNDGVTPWGINKNSSLKLGTPAPNSVIFDGESIYYLTETTNSRKIIQLAGGSAPQTISFPIDIPVERMADISDAQGFILGFRGQNFYCIDFPSANVEIDEQVYSAITLAYHLQQKAWIIIGKWNTEQGIYEQFRGASSCYIERYGKMLIGGRDGKIYEIYEDTTIDYAVTPQITHRWRDDHSKIWKNPRNVKLYGIGDFSLPADQHQGGIYKYRQHEFIYTDLSDVGEMFRAVIRTGQVSHGVDVTKRVSKYRYNIKRGANECIINGISEEVEKLSR